VPTPRPPSTTLFPYTTLFRSDEHVEEEEEQRSAAHTSDDGQQADEQLVVGEPLGVVAEREEQVGEQPDDADHPDDADGDLRRVGDRKSTRLNSSHVKISYAVF